MQEYLVAHELCHLSEFNHSANFWALVAETIPEYKKLRQEIRKISLR
jgi:predicted metal-dependent hydrolase